jgi:hypothetical protein
MNRNILWIKAAVRFRKSLEEAKLTDWIIAVCTLCILIVAMIAAVISYFQWHEMHAGGVDTHDLAVAAKAQADANRAEAESMKTLADRAQRQAEASDHLAQQSAVSAEAAMKSARDADISAQATKSMAATAAASLTAAQENEQLDQRPWLAVTSLNLVRFKADDRVQVKVTFMNSGRSPALHVQVVSVINLLAKNEAPRFLQRASGVATRALAPQTGNANTKDSDFFLAAESKEEVEHFTRTIWAWGYVRYDDAFGNPHLTQFCGFTRNEVPSAKITEGMDLFLCSDNNSMN